MSRYVALYARVSTVDKQSTESQEAALRQWATAQSDPVQWYRDKASGAKWDRKGFQRLLADVKAGKVARVVVAALDRLGRDTRGLLAFVDDLKAHDTGLLSLRESFDVSTPMGAFVLTCMAGIAQLEREIIRSRIKAGIESAHAEGKRWGGRKPGTRVTLTLEKEAAAKDMRASGKSIAVIARTLGLTRQTVYKALGEWSRVQKVARKEVASPCVE